MIGCGSFARLCHGPAQQGAAASRAGVILAACCDSDRARARAYQEAFGYRRHYADAEEMLREERPAAVILAVPPEAARAAAAPVLARGIPILLEKPPGLTPAELEELIAAAAQGRAAAQVGFNRRYMPVMDAAREFLRGFQRPGQPLRVTYEMTRQERWDRDFSTTAVHAIDAALLLAGAPFRRVRIAYEAHRRGSLEAWDAAISAECGAGTEALIRIRPVSAQTTDAATVEAAGESLAVKIPVSPQSEGDGLAEHRRDGALVRAFSDRASGAVGRMGVLGETLAFLDGVRAGAPLRPSLADCRQQVALMDAVRRRLEGPLEFAEG
jgi:myo-inositol 2-dehydrogenase/D-chiro-inositol 1-dehydrogenase